MSITANGHTASWIAEEHPGELAFVIAEPKGVHLAKQEWVVEKAYTDAREDPKAFGSDWSLVYIREPGRNNLDQAGLDIEELGSNDGSGVKAWTLVVTNLVTHKVHKFGLE